MADLWQSDQPEIQQIVDTSTGGLADFLYPPGGKGSSKHVDVVNDYTWTLTPKGTDNKGRKETPYIDLTEFRLLTSSLLNSAKYYITGTNQQVSRQTSTATTRGYKGLFDFNNPTGFSYRIPYFSEIGNEVQNSWTTLDAVEKGLEAAGVVPGLREGAETIINATRTAYEANFPRVGVMDRPKIWEQSTPRSINLKFPLFNTKQYSDIKKNWELCYLLLYQNSFNKRDFVTAIPPVFYTVYIPGQFFTIAAYVSDLKIYNRGNIRHMTIGNGKAVNIPDVFEIDITLTDMIMQSQNMLSYIVKNEQPVTVQNINDNE
jgi:hypothetical protein